VLIHLFGDQRVFNWLYETPDRANAQGLTALLVPFGPVFWLMALVEVVVLFIAVRGKNGGYALLSVFLTLMAFQFITGVPVFPQIIKNWPWAVGSVIGFMVIGVFWLLWKWDRLANNHRERYDVVFAAWCKSVGIAPDAAEYTIQQKFNFENYFASHNTDEYGLIEYQPKFSDHKSELIGWMMIWPMSMFESLLFDLLVEIWNRIYERLGKVLGRIMLRRWKGTEGHMLTPQERAQLVDDNKPKVVIPPVGPAKPVQPEDDEGMS
jgi:hypothetical protein